MLLIFSNTNAVSSPNRGKLRVRIDGSTWAIKTVKIWTGTSWVIKPVRYWTGSKWAYTFDTASFMEDPQDAGTYVGPGMQENTNDSGTYVITSSNIQEDTADSGTYLY